MTGRRESKGLLIVMPAWNEEACVAESVAEVLRCVPRADVLVVDDGSLDRTKARATAAGAEVLVLPFNLGVGAAMRAGFKYAEMQNYDVVVQVDADGQHDPVEIDRIVARLAGVTTPSGDPEAGEVDIVIGARFSGKGEYRLSGPRRWAIMLLSAALSRMAATRLTDATSGFRAANRRAIRLYARHYPPEYLGDTVESLVIALRSGLRVAQVPVHMRARRGGMPSQPAFGAAVYFFRALLALSLARIRRWPPVSGLDVGEAGAAS